MSASSLLTIDDGAMTLTVPSCAMYSGTTGKSDTGTGHGEIEYADGSARRWVRFQRLVLTISGAGPAPAGLWTLDLTVGSWAVRISSMKNDASMDDWICVPNRPQEVRDLNTGRISWSILLTSAVPES